MFVHPRDDATLVFVAPAGGHVDVLLHDGAEIEIRTISGNARFSARRDRLDVEGIDGPATFEVRIPRGAPRVELRVADRVVLRKQGDRVTGEFQADASGTRRIQLAPR